MSVYIYICVCLLPMCGQVRAEARESIRFLDLGLKWGVFYPVWVPGTKCSFSEETAQEALFYTEVYNAIDREMGPAYPGNQDATRLDLGSWGSDSP